MKIQLHLHDQAFIQKPGKGDTIKINNQITNQIFEGEMDEIAKKIGECGHTFLPAIMNGRRKSENFVAQQIFALDFDGGFTSDEFLERANRYDVKPSFIYETFSSTKTLQKFRAVFVNDCVIENSAVAEIIIAMLMKIFPESDQACKDITRLFYGGKRLVYTALDGRINIFDLSLSMQAYLKKTDPKNFSRKIQTFAKNHRIAICNNTLCIHRECAPGQQGKNEEIRIITNNIMVFNPESSFFYVIERSEKHQLSRQRHKNSENISKVQGIKEEVLIQNCKLYRDFCNIDIPHNLKFLILTNLLHIKGGESIFISRINENVEKWKCAVEYNKAHNYQPKHCRNADCPYWEECGANTILDKVTSKFRKVKELKYGTLIDAERCLNTYLEEAVIKNSYGIHLIRAQTALGKTTAYCNLVQKYCQQKSFMIVVPTTKLQEEVANELQKRDVDVFVTPNVKGLLKRMGFTELHDEIEELYNSGFGYKVKTRIREFVSENEDTLTTWQKSELDNYLNFKEKMDGTSCVVTTHAMLLGLDNEILQKYEIIVDEDILMTIFKNTSSISFFELEVLLNKGNLSTKQYSLISTLLNSKDESVINNIPIQLGYDEKEKIFDMSSELQGSVVDFLQANTYHVDLQAQKIDYFKARELPNVKMTVVSATLNEELYTRYCHGRNITVRDIEMAEYKGKLKQYTAYSLSRSNIEMQGFDKVLSRAKELVGNKDIPHITFRKYAGNSNIYYGKTEGFNEYKGRDLLVVGTPHNVPFVYRLIGAYLGYKADDVLCNRFVEYNGYMFKIMTFADTKMQNLQFYFIESELEQAIGRARILRFDCTVYLFSNFPMKQAEIIQDDSVKECRGKPINGALI